MWTTFVYVIEHIYKRNMECRIGFQNKKIYTVYMKKFSCFVWSWQLSLKSFHAAHAHYKPFTQRHTLHTILYHDFCEENTLKSIFYWTDDTLLFIFLILVLILPGFLLQLIWLWCYVHLNWMTLVKQPRVSTVRTQACTRHLHNKSPFDVFFGYLTTCIRKSSLVCCITCGPHDANVCHRLKEKGNGKYQINMTIKYDECDRKLHRFF